MSPQDGVFGFSWDIPAATAGGEYSVKVTHPYSGHAPGVAASLTFAAIGRHG